jgi:hypothetical protein
MVTRSGSFEVKREADAPFDTRDGLTLGHTRFEKVFRGALEAKSRVDMVSVITPIEGSAAYVALERIEGVLDGKRGSFCVTHVGSMRRGAQSLTITIAPDSGTGELRGITGTMSIRIAEGQHFYDINYDLGS